MEGLPARLLRSEPAPVRWNVQISVESPGSEYTPSASVSAQSCFSAGERRSPHPSPQPGAGASHGEPFNHVSAAARSPGSTPAGVPDPFCKTRRSRQRLGPVCLGRCASARHTSISGEPTGTSRVTGQLRAAILGGWGVAYRPVPVRWLPGLVSRWRYGPCTKSHVPNPGPVGCLQYFVDCTEGQTL